jgi:PPK2 family polyphosphate:nucleotide phosphotransferase
MDRTKLARLFRIDKPQHFRLAECDPADTCGLDIDKGEAKELIAAGAKELAQLQERLYAEHRWAMLLVLQGMDTAGKDSVIKHVMSGVNPQGCDVHAFKAPSADEIAHDFLWRAALVLPRRGHIVIFNRSYYEEVLVVRVHSEILQRQSLPPSLTKDIWKFRFESIRNFEAHLARNGTAIVKVHLRISKEEQRRRFLARLEEPDKQWKFSSGDLAERKLWDEYMSAYEDAIRETSTAEAPWHVVPADHKWFAQLAVSSILIDTLKRLDPQYPKIERAALAGLKEAEAALRAEAESKSRKT